MLRCASGESGSAEPSDLTRHRCCPPGNVASSRIKGRHLKLSQFKSKLRSLGRKTMQRLRSFRFTLLLFSLSFTVALGSAVG
jgi:hypothetical protein